MTDSLTSQISALPYADQGVGQVLDRCAVPYQPGKITPYALVTARSPRACARSPRHRLY